MSRLLQAASVLAGLMCFAGTAPAGPPDEKPGHVDCYGDPLPEGVIVRMGSIRFKQRTKHFPSEVAFSPDSKILAVTFSDEEGCGVLLREVATGKIIRKLDVPGNVKLGPIVFSPDAKLVAIAGEREIFVLESDRDKGFGRFIKNDGAWLCAFLPDNKTLVIAGGGASDNQYPIRLLNLESGRETAQLLGSKGPVRDLRISPDGKQLTSYDGKSICTWDLPTGQLRQRRPCKEWIREFSSDLRIGLIDDGTFDSGNYQVWDLKSDKKLCELKRKGTHCELTPDGRLLAVTEERMQLIDAHSGKELISFANSKGFDYSFQSFSPDSKLLAAWSHWGDGHKGHSYVHFWDVASGKEIRNRSPLYVVGSNDGTGAPRR
jgi:WD40 repeat protein